MDGIRLFMESPGTSIVIGWFISFSAWFWKSLHFVSQSEGGEGSKKKWEGKENVLIFQVSFLKPYDSNYYNCTQIFNIHRFTRGSRNSFARKKQF